MYGVHILQFSNTGSAKAGSTENDIEYLTPVQIGTPPRTLDLLFDTGSSDLWYGDGASPNGNVYQDVIAVGDLKVQKQAVQTAQKVSRDFTNDTMSSGLMGLAFTSINYVQPSIQRKTFTDNAKHFLDAPLFTTDLKHHKDGKYNFGFIDAAAHKGPINYSPIDNSGGFWNWTSTGYAIGENAFIKTPIQNMADSGTSLMLLPEEIVHAYYKAVLGVSSPMSIMLSNS
ncbi:hypothetical protein E4U45_006124 [Claviceps purpurea]|nr:hypothetical protein E4U45_006124 [Claviceps purpurea]